ncbi:MAG TPA: tRNA (N6-threonylcarbamoyladenosine(37)-N6)-methyltransferase TrmO [Anaerolineae bacterium]|nr:tRNA (N6-threonylcarbamoyladenosine(37)-N6)-methyltransferase TrmO [Anaerolineae bacterium]HMR64417.1 tRNA (N6-threonylcarbamoyladenosine(37)-N6)-methyltransferase TrmO [Anaerolineae bacterium]
MTQICYTPIGIIRSPFKVPVGMPIQAAATETRGEIELIPAYQAGLRDLAGFSHLILLYHFHLIRGFQLIVTPFLDTEPHGIFATRSPARPNTIGLSVVRLLQVEADRLQIAEVDIVDGTPLLDIKPYVPAFDHRQNATIGWFKEKVGNLHQTLADQRFV